MPDIEKEAEQLAAHGIVMLLLSDYIGRQPDPDAAAQRMLDVLPNVLAESYADGLPDRLVDTAGKAVRQFIEDAHAVQAPWRDEPRTRA